MANDCPFCQPDEDHILFREDCVYAIRDKYPVTDGHALVVTKRHFPGWFEALADEHTAILRAIDRCKEMIEEDYAPSGFNIGINVGNSAGQTIPHLHVHLIPRYDGDTPEPCGGVRNVIPGRGNYLAGSDNNIQLIDFTGDSNLVTGGEANPLLPHLQSCLDKSHAADLAVAFIHKTGVNLLRKHLAELLDRNGRVRIVTGDYLDATDPDALLQILDLDGDIQLRVFEVGDSSFHPKVYIFYDQQQSGTAFIGSSNLSKTALRDGVEWNYRVLHEEKDRDFQDLSQAFETLFNDPRTRPVDFDWIEQYRQRRSARVQESIADVVEPPDVPPTPHKFQQEALEALATTRQDGNQAGLVVLATGLGKTWLSAFDCNSNEFRRVLFVAHREEILNQAMQTFRRIRPRARLGRYTGKEKTLNADILFASIQTIGRAKHLKQFDRTAFDYIVVDEFHHAAARTYRQLIDHFTPKFLLGLTATPERADGGDLMGLCQDNLVYRKDFIVGIKEGLLCPFTYFGVADDVDYENIPWRSSRFDEIALTRAVATRRRAENVLEQYRKKAGKRTLAFCSSQLHADFMAKYFQQAEVKAVAVHAGNTSSPRTSAIEALAAGRIDVVFAVDIFNEGLDLPAIDTVLMLRPTQSSVIWLQQFGRGLRNTEGKEKLRVIDYIGNHRTFLVKIRALLGNSMPCGSDAEIYAALRLVQQGEVELPAGCEVTYDLQTIDVIKALLRLRPEDDALIGFFDDYRERHGRRPTAVEMYRAGYNPRSLQKTHESWLSFLQSMNALVDTEKQAAAVAGEFLRALENTRMTKSYKMLTLLSMLNQDCLPGKMGIQKLTAECQLIAERRARLRSDVGSAITDLSKLQRLLETNPIEAWSGGKGTGGKKYFSYHESEFEFTETIPDDCKDSFQDLVRELADWRLAEYLDKGLAIDQAAFVCKVMHNNTYPILKLPDREKKPGVPDGWIDIVADEIPLKAKFAKEYVNVIRDSEDSKENRLPKILLGWFGPDAGKPGTRFQVVFKPGEDVLQLSPVTVGDVDESKDESKVELWHQYPRVNIPPLFGLEFTKGAWEQGFLRKGKNMFLLVTLEKKTLNKEHRYEDQFVSTDTFQWQSQNKTTQKGTHGQLIKGHRENGTDVHLFIRRNKLFENKAAPFIYCGPVEFVSWEGEKPITVIWRLRESVPDGLHKALQVPLIGK